MSDYWNPAALAFCSSKGRVQARVRGSPVVGWTDTVVPYDIQLTADTGRSQL